MKMATMKMPVEDLDSKIQNLSISVLPNDNLNTVVAKAKDFELTDRLKALITSYNAAISQRASPEECPDAISSTVPRSMLMEIVDLFTQNIATCLIEANALVIMCRGYISNTSGNSIDVQRTFWHQIDRVYDELGQNEKEVNGESAIIRAICMPISSDAQTIANSDLLALTFEREDPKYLDSAFTDDNPAYVESQPDLKTTLLDVIDKNPQTIGVAGTAPPTNTVDIGQGETSANVETVDLTPGLLVDDARNGMLSLFSNKFMNTPLNRIKELGGNLAKVPVNDFTTVNLLSLVPKPNNPLQPTDLVSTPYNIYGVTIVDMSTLDENKSLIEQDWLVSGPSTLSDQFHEQGIPHTLYPTCILINVVEVAKRVDVVTFLRYSPNGDKVFNGVLTRRRYSAAEVFAIGSALKSLWSKVKSIKLPSPETLQMGSNLLAIGLGAAGQITGSAALTKASNVLSVINEGLGALTPETPTSYAPRASPSDQAKACLFWNTESIIPNLVQLGYEQCGKEVMSSQRLRQTLASQTREVIQGYLPVAEKPKLSNYVTLKRRRRRH